MTVHPSATELRAELARRHLREFIAELWPVVEPRRAFVSNWHIDVIADHLEAATRGELERLIINIPPRHMKSLQVAVFWPAWVWLTHPERRFLFASYSQTLSTRHSLICRRLIASSGAAALAAERDRSLGERYGYRGLLQLLMGQDAWTIADDQDQRDRFENTATGMRYATSVGGRSPARAATSSCSMIHTSPRARSRISSARR